MRNITLIMAAGLVALGTTTVNAITFEGTAVGSWVNVVSTDPTDVYSVTNADAGGVAAFNWGVPATTPFDNQFTFDGVGSDGAPNWLAAAEAPFKLGSFSYRNGSTYNGTGVTGVGLNVLLSIIDPAGIGSGNYLFSYGIIGTPNNTGDPVLDGDIVKIVGQPSPRVFGYDGNTYTLDIVGFSTDGGTTILTDFSSPEGATAQAELWGRITTNIPPSIPDGGSTLALMFLATLSLGTAGKLVRRA